MNALSEQDNLSWLLLRVSLRAKKGLTKFAEDYNLTVMQALTVCLLEPGKALSMHAISTMLVCDASNVTGIVDKLVSNVYIERRESDADRRVNTITLTSKGVDVRTALLKKITAANLPSLAAFSDKERNTLRNLLLTLLTNG